MSDNITLEQAIAQAINILARGISNTLSQKTLKKKMTGDELFALLNLEDPYSATNTPASKPAAKLQYDGDLDDMPKDIGLSKARAEAVLALCQMGVPDEHYVHSVHKKVFKPTKQHKDFYFDDKSRIAGPKGKDGKEKKVIKWLAKKAGKVGPPPEEEVVAKLPAKWNGDKKKVRNMLKKVEDRKKDGYINWASSREIVKKDDETKDDKIYDNNYMICGDKKDKATFLNLVAWLDEHPEIQEPEEKPAKKVPKAKTAKRGRNAPRKSSGGKAPNKHKLKEPIDEESDGEDSNADSSGSSSASETSKTSEDETSKTSEDETQEMSNDESTDPDKDVTNSNISNSASNSNSDGTDSDDGEGDDDREGDESSERNHYKFRAECQADVDKLEKNNKFKKALVKINVTPDETGLPDVDVEFWSALEIDEVREIMDGIVDGHVMYQSLNFADKYTGERYYQGGDDNSEDKDDDNSEDEDDDNSQDEDDDNNEDDDEQSDDEPETSSPKAKKSKEQTIKYAPDYDEKKLANLLKNIEKAKEEGKYANTKSTRPIKRTEALEKKFMFDDEYFIAVPNEKTDVKTSWLKKEITEMIDNARQ